MEIVVHSRKSQFQQKFQNKLYYFNSNRQFKGVMQKMIQLDIQSRSWAKKSVWESLAQIILVRYFLTLYEKDVFNTTRPTS